MAVPLRAFARLATRRIVAVGGPDASKFLNGLITNRIREDALGFYAGFLGAKGRVITDSFLYPYSRGPGFAGLKHENGFLVEIDSEMGGRMAGMLKAYKLRADVEIKPLEEATVWAVWDDTEAVNAFGSLEEIFENDSNRPFIGTVDERAAGSCTLRLVLPSGVSPCEVLNERFVQDMEEADIKNYRVRRMMLGIPEGSSELVPDKALPLESCMDYMGGVDFNKGCYVGQELTIRSHHHGVVRKRVIPVVLTDEAHYATQELAYDPDASSHLQITPSCLVGTSIVDTTGATAETSKLAPSPFASSSEPSSRAPPASGSIIAAEGNVALALVRLEHFANPDARFAIRIPNPDNSTKSILIKGFQPYWWPE
ncbi:hypothetical protein TRVA0_032S00606 [Trichomonascus vanleenenianus]|uniref:Iba57p n=1 Tax=Trichomonascus vanleenenianus TaxID=2268995 RepID=UPI003ECA2FBD